MAWRFKASKFKNTSPKNPKREDCIIDLPIGTLTCSNNGIKASNSLIAFHIDGEGGKLGVLPVDAKGRKLRQDLAIICAHADAVTDFDFLPFNDRTLVTCSRDDKVKLWIWDQNANFPSTVGTPSGSIDLGADKLIECLSTHPTAADVLALGYGQGAIVCDVNTEKAVIELSGLSDRVHTLSWHGNGQLLAVEDKSHEAAIFDPRSGTTPISTTKTHPGSGREGRILFLGETDKLVTTGFSMQKSQQMFLYDCRKFGSPIHKQELGQSTGVLIPLYDADTKLLFLAGKGSNKVHICELADKEPLISQVSDYQSPDPTLGACLVPKTVLNVMDGEVQRLMQLTKNTIYPVPCIVPRRTYRDFIPDLFPDTVGGLPGCQAEKWFSGDNTMPCKYSLNPSKLHLMNKETISQDPKPLLNGHSKIVPQLSENDSINTSDFDESLYTTANERTLFMTPETPPEIQKPVFEPTTEKPAEALFMRPEPIIEKTPVVEREQSGGSVGGVSVTQLAKQAAERIASETPPVPFRDTASLLRSDRRPASVVIGVKQSKYRHCETHSGGKLGQYTNLRKINTRLPLESNGFCVSNNWSAVPLAGPGGVILILDHSNPKKIPDGVIPGFENKNNVTDLCWSPFDQDVLAVGCENGTVNIWRVPTDGVNSLDIEPERSFQAGSDKIVSVRYNPVAENVLAVATHDGVVQIWDLSPDEAEMKISLEGHSESILSLSWSNNGNRLVTASKDGYVKVYEPKLSTSPIVEKKLLESTRAARVLFACDDKVILGVTFSRASDRQLTLLDCNSLTHLHTLLVDTSPQILIPHYDADSSVLVLCGKGDRMLHLYEVCSEEPWFLKLAPFMGPSNHQSISFEHKNKCDVRSVQFAKGWRLTEKNVECLSFKVPRIKKDLFQSDLFPDALVTWSPSLTADQWFNDDQMHPIYQSLKPDNMQHLYEPKKKTEAIAKPSGGDVPGAIAKPSGEEAITKPSDISIEPIAPPRQIRREAPETKQEIADSMHNQMNEVSKRLDECMEQDAMEGVEEEEWIE